MMDEVEKADRENDEFSAVEIEESADPGNPEWVNYHLNLNDYLVLLGCYLLKQRLDKVRYYFGHRPISLKFTFTENGLGAHSPKMFPVHLPLYWLAGKTFH